MIVKELIKRLQKLPDDHEVISKINGYYKILDTLDEAYFIYTNNGKNIDVDEDPSFLGDNKPNCIIIS